MSLRARLREFARTPINKTEGAPTYWKSLVGGRNWMNTAQGRALNLVQNFNGITQYNPALVQTAMLAGLNWVNTMARTTLDRDRQDIANDTGIPFEEVTQTFVDDMNNGVSRQIAVRSLASEIERFWGLRKNRDASDSHAKGITEAIAKEILA